MNQGKTVFAQLMSNISKYEFEKCVERYKGNYKVQSFTCLEHFYVMCFAQLTYRESLRDIAACLVAFSTKLYHSGIKNAVPKSTFAEANENRNWRIYAKTIYCQQFQRFLNFFDLNFFLKFARN